MLLESKHIIDSAVHPFSGTAFVVEFFPLITRTGHRREDPPVCFQGMRICLATGNRFAVNDKILSKTIQIIIAVFQEHFEDFSQLLMILSQFRHEAGVTARRGDYRIAVKDVEAAGLGQ